MTDTSKEAVERGAAELDQMEALHRTGFPPERRGTADRFGKAATILHALAQRCADLESDNRQLIDAHRIELCRRMETEAERDAIAAAMVEAAADECGHHLSTPDDVVLADDIADRIRALTTTDALAKLDAIRAEERAAGMRLAADILKSKYSITSTKVNGEDVYGADLGSPVACYLTILAAMEKEQGE